MSVVQVSGTLPSEIVENTPLGEWTGQLRIHLNPGLIRFVDIIGFGGSFFDAWMNPRTGSITITPIAMADFEWFVGQGVAPSISFSLRFYMQDGSVADSATTYTVKVRDVDDTPPQALAFASGGTVAAGQQGASIGRLAASDPDTKAGITYTIREDDQWMLEVVDDVLQLRPGVSIPLAEGPQRPVVITASDGKQSAAFTLNIGITALGLNEGRVVDLLEAHETSHGFRWAGAGNVFTTRMSTEVASVQDLGGLIQIMMRDGGSVLMEQPKVIDLLDGYITFAADGLAARVWAIYETVFNRDPRHGEMAAGVARLAAGTSQEVLIGGLLASPEFARPGTLSHTAFVEGLFRNSVGWTDAGAMAWHVGNLEQGRSRAAVADGFVKWRLDDLHHADPRAENGGFFVPRAWVQALDTLQPGAADPVSVGQWQAQQVVTGALNLPALPDAFLRVPGILPRLDAPEGMGRLERMFRDMAGAPPESSWASTFGAGLMKQGISAEEYLQGLVRGVDFDHLHATQTPAGLAFQAGW